jgi:hypothetical protein
MGAGSGMSIKESQRWIHTHIRAVDKFTKWIKVKPAASITTAKVWNSLER